MQWWSASTRRSSWVVVAVGAIIIGCGHSSKSCPVGTEGCACSIDQVCSEGLECSDGRCVLPMVDAVGTGDGSQTDSMMGTDGVLPLDGGLHDTNDDGGTTGLDTLSDTAPPLDSVAETGQGGDVLQETGGGQDTAHDAAVDGDGGCVPACEGKECGSDGCGGICGACPMAAPLCTEEGLCAVGCLPECTGKECGDDGCEGTCGTCPAAAPFCTDEGLCSTTCDPDCANKECGDDGCGGTCGTCASPYQVCSFTGHCAAPPSCTNSADAAIVTPDFDAAWSASISCGFDCGGLGDDLAAMEQCTKNCMVAALGVSAACASCFSAATLCWFEHCGMLCYPGSYSCEGCEELYGCSDIFELCAGLPFE